MTKELKILDTSPLKPGTHINDVVQASKLLNYKHFRFNGAIYDLEKNIIENLK